MQPWILLDSAAIAGEKEPLRLMRRGDEFSILLGNNTLMSNRMSGSEEALADLAIAKLGERKAPHVLIGGLGIGFTLRAALKALGPGAKITVAELVPKVVEWARGPMAEVFDGCLDEPRVHVHQGDVAALMVASKGVYDAIMLDVDNGPEGMTQSANDGLYGHKGLNVAKAALRSGGVLSVWSSAPDEAFTRRMRDAGFATESVNVRARSNGKGPRHVIWVGVRG